MVPDWILPVATAGASALVAVAATDAWTAARAQLVRLFLRSGLHRQQIEAALSETEAEVARTGGRAPDTLAGLWESRFADVLARSPELHDEVRAWTGRFRPEPAAVPQRVYNSYDRSQQINGDHVTVHNHPSR